MSSKVHNLVSTCRKCRDEHFLRSVESTTVCEEDGTVAFTCHRCKTTRFIPLKQEYNDEAAPRNDAEAGDEVHTCEVTKVQRKKGAYEADAPAQGEGVYP